MRMSLVLLISFISLSAFARLVTPANQFDAPKEFKFNLKANLLLAGQRASSGHDAQYIQSLSVKNEQDLRRVVQKNNEDIASGFLRESYDAELGFVSDPPESLKNDWGTCTMNRKSDRHFSEIQVGEQGQNWSIRMVGPGVVNSLYGISRSAFSKMTFDFVLTAQSGEVVQMSCISLCVNSGFLSRFNSCDAMNLPEDLTSIFKSLGVPLDQVQASRNGKAIGESTKIPAEFEAEIVPNGFGR